MVTSTAKKIAEGGGALDISQVQKLFIDPTGAQVIALEGVNLDIRPGEFVSLLGPSGCGKSTLLRLIAGLEKPTAGSITLDGEVVEGPHYFRGLVFQDPTLFPWLTIQQNVGVGLDARGIGRQSQREVEEYIGLVGLAGFENSYPYQLSGGMAQRAALARALVNHPKVLLMDEPLGALDAFTRMNMQDELLRIWESRGTTIVFVTHDIDEAIYLSDRIVVMTPRPGKIAKIVDVHIPRPRSRNYPDFVEIRSQILELLHFAGKNKPEYYL
jgi:NitT/TauT family transport system ATP-binding protein/sulfonate transport system ATP-binding protein